MLTVEYKQITSAGPQPCNPDTLPSAAHPDAEMLAAAARCAKQFAALAAQAIARPRAGVNSCFGFDGS